jgi:hypothetical protein
VGRVAEVLVSIRDDNEVYLPGIRAEVTIKVAWDAARVIKVGFAARTGFIADMANKGLFWLCACARNCKQ